MKMQRRFWIGWLAAAIATAMLPQSIARADDSSSGVSLPELQSKPPGMVAVLAASVRLMAAEVVVALKLSKPTGSIGELAIDGPRFGWLGEAEPYPSRQFPELRILLDEKPIQSGSSFVASIGSTDISNVIRDLHVDPFAVAETPPFIQPAAHDAQALTQLEHLGAIEKYNNDYLAKWTVQRKIRIPLPSAPDATLTLNYRARPGFGLLPFTRIASPARLAEYCLAKQDLGRAMGEKALTRSFIVSDYVIPVGIGGAPPATLSVSVLSSGKERRPPPLVAFCGSKGEAVIGQTGELEAPARADPRGLLHIMTIRAID